MEFQLRVKPSAQKELNKLSKEDYYRILAAFSLIVKDPFIGKKLKREYCGCYSYRIWPHRIIYQIYKKELAILVIKIGHRQGVYR
ncbi:type II toxin-antitoxin system RelE/ParE family toxin [Patescibacteria group bacterium]|nr:type II toxin-antitoxin system RelE/ParE family toxin [Patescibacteria group bacterium]MBU4274478.1 type II toxin-antitoxin system RelE/ParE family toxin [Patescibacteria group bacterium]MBU4367383.1 type II toxin-antitoxin system RelE/ParE family toxin [Patescibacteria group bacterium]MBU4461704.1 type II toxin-antitoxin system RelE/ParE family toxin [Patescibacteria group bacterium]MCG2700087.1 type II toxin-antitoxin system RelE/ParE family toxin [Candidatus Parcubacteria bacterium]